MTPCEKLGYKEGDKFRVLSGEALFPRGAVVELYRDDGSHAPCFKGKTKSGTLFCAGGEEGAFMYLERIEKIQQVATCPQSGVEHFLKTQPWFIRTGDSETSAAVQEWLFKNGQQWASGGGVKDFSEQYISNTDTEGVVHAYFMHGRPGPTAQEIVVGIKVTREVDDFTLPTPQSTQERKIAELEETIATAQRQVAELRRG